MNRNEVAFSNDDTYRYVYSNGIPWSYGGFPNSRNPNEIQAQNYNFRMPLYPHVAKQITPLTDEIIFGIGMDGIPFNPGTNEFWNNNPDWTYELNQDKQELGMDFSASHLQGNGAYHYQGMPIELIVGQTNSQHSKIIGYAADGFPIYAKYGYADVKNPDSGIKQLHSSYQLLKGSRPGGTQGPGGIYDGTYTQDYVYVADSGDLDECNGRSGPTPDYPDGTYYYFITEDFPYISRCFKGTPDPSFSKTAQHTGLDW